MNYLTMIKMFYDFAQSNDLTTAQIALWHALMYIDNKTGWKRFFTASIKSISLASGLSKSGIQKARKALADMGLIEFIPGASKVCTYRIIDISELFKNQSPSAYEASADFNNFETDADTNTDDFCDFCTPLYKLNQTKQDENNNTYSDNIKRPYGKYQNVFLTDEDIANLKLYFHETWEDKINKLSHGIELHGYKYSNHYLAIIEWNKNYFPA